ncbi:MAG: hypothetical protein OHK0048_09410 [Rhodoferax sp.]
MLDWALNQAAGLQALGLEAVPRLVSVASHGDQRLELPLLWALCRNWIDQGHTVLVLDGHSTESADNPGLLQKLQQGGLGPDEDGLDGSWKIMPAASGLAALDTPNFIAIDTPQRQLASLFAHFGVVVVYAPASVLAALLRGTEAQPLVVVPPLHEGVLTAYRALKQLRLDGQLQATVTQIVLPELGTPSMTQTAPMEQLKACARNFLGLELKPIRLRAGTTAPEALTTLALQLLENAVLLQRHSKRSVH